MNVEEVAKLFEKLVKEGKGKLPVILKMIHEHDWFYNMSDDYTTDAFIDKEDFEFGLIYNVETGLELLQNSCDEKDYEPTVMFTLKYQ